MWADTLFGLERGHLLRLAVWAALSVVVGGVILLSLRARKAPVPFLRHFGIQMLAWGVVDLALAAWSWRGLAFRDYAASLQLQNFLWLNVGLDAGYMGIGITLALAGWLLGQRLGALGAGVGVIVQGFALFVLDLRLLTIIDTARVAVIAAPARWLFT
ncbi:MAG: DUF6992 family protein [Gemmatimonas sp.]